MTLRQALNITQSWIITRSPREITAAEKLREALSNEFHVADEIPISEMSEDTVEALLDSF